VVLDDPLTPEEHLNLGVAYEKKGELDSAIKEYELAANKLSIAYLYLGNAYFQKEILDEAEKYYRMRRKSITGWQSKMKFSMLMPIIILHGFIT
jgi:tetratricopeptide (TPR) repeat protein